MRRPAASCSAWIRDSAPSLRNWTSWHRPKNEATLAGQIAELYERGTTGIVEHDGGVEAFFDSESDAQPVLTDFVRLRPRLRVYGSRDYVSEFQQQWQPIDVGDRFWLAAPWDESPTPPGRLRLDYQAGMACGSGLHPCTRLSIAALEKCVKPGSTVLDVGAGSGILLIAAQMLGARQLAGCDIDHDSIALASRALPEVCFFTGSAASVKTGAFDVVVANISSSVAEELRDELFRTCRGTLIVSGFRQDDLPEGYRGDLTVLDEWAAISESSSTRS